MKQKKQVNYRPKKRWGTTLIPLLTLTALAGVLALLAAGAWQLMDPVPYVPPQHLPWNRVEASSSKGAPAKNVPTPTPTPAPTPTPTPTPPPERSWVALVPKSEWVASSYFDDALFVGDSITEGIKLYNIMSNATVLSYTGINLDNIFTKPVIKAGEGEDKLTIIDAAKAQQPRKIYLLMGANSMLSDEATFVKSYGRLVDELHRQHPDAQLYVQSILPVTEAYSSSKPDFSNTKIDEYNRALQVMAEEKQVFYLNVAEVFKDEQGALPTEASPKDGMHFSSDWYRKWFDYLRNHTVTGEGINTSQPVSQS